MTVRFEQSKPQFTGARVERAEDARLLTGRARYLDDLDFPGTLEVAFVRSTHAAAKLVSVHAEAASRMPGVRMVWTAADIHVTLDSPEFGVNQPVLAKDEVRYVGEPVVAIFADSRYAAEDAADTVEVTYADLPPVLHIREALQAETRRVHAERPNVMYHQEYQTDGFEEAFENALHHLSATFTLHRQTAVPMETRGCMAAPDGATNRLHVYVSHQSPHGFRADLCKFLGVPEHAVRVIVPEVGGAFGIKAMFYPEYVVVALAALRLRRPVKWIADRSECLLADCHARDGIHDVDVAFDGDGRILALRDHLMGDSGAYPAVPFCGSIGETSLAARMLTGPYKIPHLSFTIDCTYSNKAPLGAYRGVWGPPASFVQEGVVDRVARALHKDPVAVRRINLLQPEDFPYRTASGFVYDPGSYAESLETALELVDYDGFRKRQREDRSRGVYRGIGISVFVEPTAMAASEAGDIPYEAATVRMEPTGTVTAALGLGPSGQGHETTMAQLIADELGVDVRDVVVLHGDTDSAPYGGGTGGSRSGTIGGGAALTAGRELRDKLLALAAHLLEADVADIELKDGAAHVAGVPAQRLTVQQLATAAYTDVNRLPEGMKPGLEVMARYQPTRPITFSNGTHIAVVDVDVATGQIQTVDYVVANDCGVLINPTIVEGQIHGGVAQGIGEALLEELKYDTEGQLTTVSLSDYLLPTTHDIPNIRIRHLVTPSESKGGFKGMGEGSLIAAPAAVVAAVSDALEPFGVMVSSMPVTPDQVLEWIDADQEKKVDSVDSKVYFEN
jgi:carbon-monoxide dehydrogenase large subunit